MKIYITGGSRQESTAVAQVIGGELENCGLKYLVRSGDKEPLPTAAVKQMRGRFIGELRERLAKEKVEVELVVGIPSVPEAMPYPKAEPTPEYEKPEPPERPKSGGYMNRMPVVDFRKPVSRGMQGLQAYYKRLCESTTSAAHHRTAAAIVLQMFATYERAMLDDSGPLPEIHDVPSEELYAEIFNSTEVVTEPSVILTPAPKSAEQKLLDHVAFTIQDMMKGYLFEPGNKDELTESLRSVVQGVLDFHGEGYKFDIGVDSTDPDRLHVIPLDKRTSDFIQILSACNQDVDDESSTFILPHSGVTGEQTVVDQINTMIAVHQNELPGTEMMDRMRSSVDAYLSKYGDTYNYTFGPNGPDADDMYGVHVVPMDGRTAELFANPAPEVKSEKVVDLTEVPSIAPYMKEGVLVREAIFCYLRDCAHLPSVPGVCAAMAHAINERIGPRYMVKVTAPPGSNVKFHAYGADADTERLLASGTMVGDFNIS